MKLRKTNLELLKIVGKGAVAHHERRNHKRRERPAVKGLFAWLNQPIHMEIIFDEQCNGCRALKAYSNLKRELV
jgi:hypothetical protein